MIHKFLLNFQFWSPFTAVVLHGGRLNF